MLVIDKWPGLVTNASPYAIPPGASSEQVNLICINPGQLITRDGLTAKTYESNDTSSTVVIKMFRFQDGANENLLYQDSDGNIYCTLPIYTLLVTENDDVVCDHNLNGIAV
tara:strand:- start:132 stop:464 length:333 start_codon:yes stop_codon:yes gene_type:complete